MNYRIVELKFGTDPEKSYYKPQRKKTNDGIISSSVVEEWEDYPNLRGSACETYEKALEVIKAYHVEVIQYHSIDL